ncbi:hypothetical protein CDD80_4301 [Ophiocordyceps camponoti-rufipedis]|uniref:Fungal-type protein kinase domain-containing protein n=1 Tax=Ophiocordyceps camponoti-rufipedis TaxID=2004952 RepID=A0A2C5YYZ3_9HYPO|nr:hypothetical protein CDD80_4301 [Ophiocordyceps camponoti-rufipedis]
MDFGFTQKDEMRNRRYKFQHLSSSRRQFREDLLQLLRYARAVFTEQPLRKFVPVSGQMTELWIIDRSGPFSSGEFNVNKEPDRFATALGGYSFMKDFGSRGWRQSVEFMMMPGHCSI